MSSLKIKKWLKTYENNSMRMEQIFCQKSAKKFYNKSENDFFPKQILSYLNGFLWN